jgi:twitching motility protein PilT
MNSRKQILLKDKEFDFSFAFGDLGRFRANAFHERGNLAVSLRLIPNDILSTLEQLGLASSREYLRELSKRPGVSYRPNGFW